MAQASSLWGRNERFGRAADRGLLVAALLLAVFLLLLLLGFRFGRDQGIYAAVADIVLAGGAPYRDAWDFKPPLIFFLYAATGVFGSDMVAIRVLEALALASLFPAFWLLSKRHLGDGRAGALAGALAVLVHVQLEYWDTAQPESFGGIATVWAIVCATGVARPARGGFGAGLLYTLAAFLKVPLGGGAIVSLGFRLAERPRAARLRTLAGYAGGALVVLAPLLVFFTLHGAWHDIHETFFVFVPEYHALRFETAPLPEHLLRAGRIALFGFSALLPLGVGLLLLLPPLSGAERRGASHVAGVAAVQVLGVGLQARFYPYHFGGTLPLLSLLAGWGLWKGWLRLRARPLLALAALAALASLLSDDAGLVSYGPMSFWERARWRVELLLGSAGPDVEARLHSTMDVHFGANRRAAAWLRENTPSDARIYIWGFEPMIYTMSGRRSASCYVYNLPQRVDWPGRDVARDRLVEELRSNPPAAIVVVEHDACAALTGHERDSREELALYPAFRYLLGSRYEAVRRFEDLTVHVMRDR